jgi:hypothetical protein
LVGLLLVGALLLALILLHGTYDLLETTGMPCPPLLMSACTR